MKRKKIYSILSYVIIFSMLLPQFSVKAITTDISNSQGYVNEDIIEYESISSTYQNEEVENSYNSQNEEDMSNLEDVQSEEYLQEDQDYYNENIEYYNEYEETDYDLVESYDSEEETSNDIVGEIYQVKVSKVRAYSFEEETNYEREEFNLKSKNFDDVYELELKTDSNFEIALAHEDGSYSYLDSADTMEEALEKIEEAEENSNTKARTISLSDENNVPVILNEDGIVVYSDRAMGRILKHINGNIYKYFDRNTNLYSDSSLKSAFTYINQGYVDDVPIIEDNGKSAKIMVNGYAGWINRDVTSYEYDMIIVPINQVKNPSYYKSENGLLKHYITSNLKATVEDGNGYTITVGVAPSYMKEGVKYLSYDGNYFYDGSNLENGLNNLVGDLQSGNYSNAINSNNPYYNYYNYLPFRSKTSYSAQDLEKFITENTAAHSKLRGISTTLIDGESKYGVNALLSLGIAINESGWGLSTISQTKNNIFGINAVDSNPGQAADQFSSPSQCVEEFMKNQISRAYADPSNFAYYGGFLGKKNYGANVKYASDPFWGEKASQYAFQVDYYLSGKNINNLKDFNKNQIGLYVSNTSVKNSNGTVLYEVTNNLRNYGCYVGTTTVITSNLGDRYEINPEIDTPLYSGSTLMKYSGLYNFSNKAYISSSSIKLINSTNINNDNSNTNPNPNINKWVEINGKKYYYDSNGNLYKGWLYQNGKWYYLNNDGSMATGWKYLDGHWYYLYQSGDMAKGWIKVDGYWYYLYQSGDMATGWVKTDGYWYYLYQSGAMATNWVKVDGYWYYLYQSGSMATGWVKVNGYWYYLYQSGPMATSWVKVDGKWYYLQASGEMLTGNVNIGGINYYFNSDGSLA